MHRPDLQNIEDATDGLGGSNYDHAHRSTERYVGCTVTFEQVASACVIPRATAWEFAIDRKGCEITRSGNHSTLRKAADWLKEATGLEVRLPTRPRGRGYSYEIVSQRGVVICRRIARG